MAQPSRQMVARSPGPFTPISLFPQLELHCMTRYINNQENTLKEACDA